MANQHPMQAKAEDWLAKADAAIAEQIPMVSRMDFDRHFLMVRDAEFEMAPWATGDIPGLTPEQNAKRRETIKAISERLAILCALKAAMEERIQETKTEREVPVAQENAKEQWGFVKYVVAGMVVAFAIVWFGSGPLKEWVMLEDARQSESRR